jgi:hypothetical protein
MLVFLNNPNSIIDMRLKLFLIMIDLFPHVDEQKLYILIILTLIKYINNNQPFVLLQLKNRKINDLLLIVRK